MSKERQRRYRDKQRALRSDSVTQGGVTVEMIPPSYVYGTTGKYQFLPERPRYLTLSDGQVLDRLNPPQPQYHTRSMNMCNESRFNYPPTKRRGNV